ncbi:MAG: LysR family transcriptional regulator [Proteobacteria bacterium]|nr:LysR family transcriptional regulator [Pseudomonadota bacterium]
MCIIDLVNLANVDLNLLVALDALLAERNVTRAAARVGLTQSAMSNTLRRLRSLLDDPVLVRTGQGMLPTPRALELAEPIRTALEQLAGALAVRDGFDARRAERVFRIYSTDSLQFMLLPALAERLGREAPGIDLEFRHSDRGDPVEDLRRGRLDLIVGPVLGAWESLSCDDLFHEDMAAVVRQDHPDVGRRLTLKRFVEIPHVVVSPFGRGGASFVDEELESQGLSRRIALQTPHFLVVPYVLAESDWLAVLPRRVAQHFAEFLPLRILKPPIEHAGFDVRMRWDPRSDADPGHRWLRGLVSEVCGGL